MAIFKCKMCGGTLEINNETVAICEYCGTKQTLPKLSDERKATLFDRANHFRRGNEFDKAMGIYEQILNEDNTDAECYWSLVLCRFGIEYVEDPATHKRIPTVNRAQFTSIFDDENYKSALQYADASQKEIYEVEAAAINDIQKGILAISNQEEPFDVFICYKETDTNGRRTPDSVLATELYHELTREGFKVFFSRITLEDKLGSAYEPYIFAALNSAKVMVVLGTKPEYFNAVWVKNEWSRYLALIKNGARKMLIPAYKDMDPYDLPEEFSLLQAQDMSKLGFMQDLIRGIKKIVESGAEKQVVHETVVTSETVSGNVKALLDRGFMALEDGEWTKADDFFEQSLNQNAKLAEAYLGKLMADLKVTTQDGLKDCATSFDTNKNYQKVIRFADANLKAELAEYIKHINNRIDKTHVEGIYNRAKNAMAIANTEAAYKEAARLFESILSYMDSEKLVQECLLKAELTRKDAILAFAKSKMVGETVRGYEEAIKIFQAISGWKNADELILVCKKKIEAIQAREEADRLEKERQAEIERKEAEHVAKRNKTIAFIICVVVAIAIVLNILFTPSIRLKKLKNAKIGDTVFFGEYEQDNNTTNGKEDIEWLVLEVQDSKALLISKYALDCQPYNTSDADITWETCSLRKWLNSNFINTAFSADEKELLSPTTVSADLNPEFGTTPGNPTEDLCFLLSSVEVSDLFDAIQNRLQSEDCEVTKYAKQKQKAANSWVDPINFWWLRTPASSSNRAAGVYGNYIRNDGRHITNQISLVRPAFWIDLSQV